MLVDAHMLPVITFVLLRLLTDLLKEARSLPAFSRDLIMVIHLSRLMMTSADHVLQTHLKDQKLFLGIPALVLTEQPGHLFRRRLQKLLPRKNTDLELRIRSNALLNHGLNREIRVSS